MPPKTRKSTKGASSSKAPSTSRAKRQRLPPPIPLPWPFEGDDHEEEYGHTCQRKLLPTRYVDHFALEHLELEEEVTQLFHNIGWLHFIHHRMPTFKELTYEFLSSFSCSFSPYGDPSSECIYFRCMGRTRSLSLDQWNDIFGLPRHGTRWYPGEPFSHDLAWKTLSFETEYNPSRSKSTQLKSPALRYIHRFMASSIFGRAESTGVVTKYELFFLWAMTQNIPVNTGAWFIKHVLQVAKGTDKICIGGLITTIAQHYGFIPEPGVHTRVAGPDKIDLATLVNMGLCTHVGDGQYHLLDARGDIIPKRRQHDGIFEERNQPMEEEIGSQAETEGEASPRPTHASSSSQQGISMEHMMARMMDRFDRLDARFDRIENRLDRSERRNEEMYENLQQRFNYLRDALG